MVEGWRDGLDVLLVFAGLFSAVVTTFVAQTSQSLQVDYGAVTASLLIELINVQCSASNGSLVNDVPRSDLTFEISSLSVRLMGQWLVVHQSLIESHDCTVRCLDKTVDPPVHALRYVPPPPADTSRGERTTQLDL
ncbi:uncharacterized protein EV420DRAFT_1588865, partial [Desarmillaria tabescens]